MSKMFFTAESCYACKSMYSLAKEAGFDIISLDTDEGVDIANRYSVRGLPTWLAFDEFGSVIWRHVGTIHKTELESK